MNIERTYGNVPLNVTMTKTVISMLMSIITVVMVNGLIQEDLLLVGQIKSQHMSRMVRMISIFHFRYLRKLFNIFDRGVSFSHFQFCKRLCLLEL